MSYAETAGPLPIHGRERHYINTKNLCIVNQDGQYGIKDVRRQTFLIPAKYDNIFRFGDFFKLVRKGQTGFYRVEVNEEETKYFVDRIAPCYYDSIVYSGMNTILLYQNHWTRYYNVNTRTLSKKYKMLHKPPNGDYIQAWDEGAYYVIDAATDEILYQEECEAARFPVYEEIGRTKENNAVLRNASPFSQELLYKGANGYGVLPNYAIVGWIDDGEGYNIANIAENADAFGLIDGSGNLLTDICYDSIQADIRFTLKNDGETIEKILPYAEYKSNIR